MGEWRFLSQEDWEGWDLEYGNENDPKPPAGLYLTRGDGVAVQVTAEMLAKALRKISFVPGMVSAENLAAKCVPALINRLLEQIND